jgi:hypothetical protein
MLPFEPELISALKTRLPKALERVWNISECGEDRPTLHREHIFDFNCGLRLAISKDDFEDGLGPQIHVSSSFDDSRYIQLDALIVTVNHHWKSIGGIGILKFLGLSAKGIPHFFIDKTSN